MVSIIPMRRFLGRRRAVIVGLVLLALSLLCFSYLFGKTPFQDGHFYDFALSTETGGEHGKSGLRYFRQVQGQDLFLYSAISNEHEPMEGEVNIIISAMDSAALTWLQCCVILQEGKLYTSQATVFHQYFMADILGPLLELFKNTPTKAKQYSCVIPQLGFKAVQVTLTTDRCPVQKDRYLPVLRPNVLHNGLALCAKTAYGEQLDPGRLMEWFEVQRLLGVEHIQLMDLNNPEPIQRVFKYYKDMGLLNILPYELPGPPYQRGLDSAHWVPDQASHDETFPILDCRQRLRGYTYVIGHDLDEVIMPRKDHSLKDLLKEQLMRNPDAAGFFFYTQFFVYDWGPTNNGSDVSLLRYLNSTLPRNECRKYVYLSSRATAARTHDFTAKSQFTKYYVPKEDAILHHYRKCPAHTWSTCNPQRMTDNSMLRFQGQLEERLMKARQATGLGPARQ